MKHNLLKIFALVMAMVMVLSAIPFALATGEGGEGATPPAGDGANPPTDGGTQEPSCSHAVTNVEYEAGTGGTHTKKVVCDGAECKEVISSTSEACTAGTDGKCTLCDATLSSGEGEEDDCAHTVTKTTYETSASVGKHTKKVVCDGAECGKVISENTESCSDSNSDKKCDLCGEDIPDDLPYIECGQDGTETTSDSVKMIFTLKNVDTSSVNWEITVSGSADPELKDVTKTGNPASATVYGEGGTAKVSVTATWGTNSESDTFYVSFYSGASHTVVVKSNVKQFDFTETGVFSKVDGSTAGVSKISLHTLLTDGSADRVILSEDRAGNARVGKITCETASKFYQYDPKDENEYSLADLDELSFEVLSGGEYHLDYELYEYGGSSGYTTTKGTIIIKTGTVEGDIKYTCKIAGSLKFDADDFEEFWETEGKKNEALKYVTFEVSNSTDMTGYLAYDDSTVKSAWKFYADYEKKSNTYDLNEVEYIASKKEKNYTDMIAFVAYGEDGTQVAGTVAVTVKDTTMPFTDVSTSDWFYKEVYTVWSEGLMNGNDTTGTIFAPNATLTRAMVVTMIYRMENEPAVGQYNTFSDVPAGKWYTYAVEWAAKNDIVNGYNGKFSPEDPITREQLAAILYRYADYKEMGTSAHKDLAGYPDGSSVSDYATTAMQWAVGAKIINGTNTGKLNPGGTATRAEAATMFARFMDL